ncbi:zinc-dependent alcohol dehydrogenase family protein [Streptomyces sp. SGAir0957]
MRAYTVQAGGGLALTTQRAVPAPSAGEVQVRVKATSLNARDRLIVSDTYSVNVQGRVPLSDGAGIVEAVGEGVTRFHVGDRVMGAFHPTWLYGPYPGWTGLPGTHCDGWLRDYVVLDQQSLVAIPDTLSFEEAATLPCAALTAWSAVDGTGPGTTLLVQGSGGVSVFALQFARLVGARVVATTSDDAKAERLRTLGAHDIVNYKETPHWGVRVHELTGNGVSHVLEVGGAGTLEQSIKALAYGGQIALVGNLASGNGMDVNEFFGKAATLRSISVGSRSELEQMSRTVARSGLRPVIDTVFPFSQAPEAFDHFERGPRFGKVVIIH